MGFPPNTPYSPPFLAPWSESHLISSKTFSHERHNKMNKFIANYLGTFTSGGND